MPTSERGPPFFERPSAGSGDVVQAETGLAKNRRPYLTGNMVLFLSAVAGSPNFWSPAQTVVPAARFLSPRTGRPTMGKGVGMSIVSQAVVERGRQLPQAMTTVAELVESYLSWVGRRIKPATLASHRIFLAALVKTFGDLPVSSMKAYLLEEWANRPNWNPSTQYTALGIAGRMFRWAERTERIETNPIKNLSRPRAKSRGAETVISPEVHRRLLKISRRPFPVGPRSQGRLSLSRCFRHSPNRPGRPVGQPPEVMSAEGPRPGSARL